MNIGCVTDVGCVREINEDTIVAEAIPPHAANSDGLTAVLLVADGMGGHQAGEVASGLAGEITRQAFLAPQSVPGGSPGQSRRRGLPDAPPRWRGASIRPFSRTAGRGWRIPAPR